MKWDHVRLHISFDKRRAEMGSQNVSPMGGYRVYQGGWIVDWNWNCIKLKSRVYSRDTRRSGRFLLDQYFELRHNLSTAIYLARIFFHSADHILERLDAGSVPLHPLFVYLNSPSGTHSQNKSQSSVTLILMSDFTVWKTQKTNYVPVSEYITFL